MSSKALLARVLVVHRWPLSRSPSA